MLCATADRSRLCFAEYRAARIFDTVNKIRCHLIAAICKYRVSSQHLHGRNRTRTECHGEIRVDFACIKTKLHGVIFGVLGSNRLQDANRHHIFRFNQCLAHAHRAIKFPVVVFRFPRLTAGLFGIKHQWRIIDNGGGGKAFFQRGGINERLKAGAGLTQGLGDVIELIASKVKPAYQ